MRHALLIPVFSLMSCIYAAEPVRQDKPLVVELPPDAGVAAPVKEAKPMPPPTRTQVIKDTIFGAAVEDPYRWLEDEKSPEVQAWMKAQDDFARAQLHKLPARDALLARYKELYYVESYGVPVKRGGRYFYTRTHKDKEKAIVYWRQGAKGEEKVLLDPNTWSTDNTVSLGVWVPSWDGKKVVFAEKPNAADEATLYVLDVDSGKRSELDVIPGGKYASPSWAPDSKSFIYEWLPVDPSIPTSERPGYCEVRLHQLGDDPKNDAQLHPKTGDPKTFIGGAVSRDGKFQFVHIMRGWNENDVFFKRVGKDKDWQLLVKGKDAKYGVDVWKGVFYVFTDEGAPNKRVFKVDPNKPDRKSWKELIPEDKDAARASLTVVGGHLAIASLKKAVSAVELFTLDGKKVREVQLPGLGTSSNLVGLEDDDEAYFSYSSFVSPPQVFKTSVKSGKSELWAKVELPVDPSKFDVRQVTYESKDKTPITMFIVAAKDVKLTGDNPVMLYGYGGFDISLTSAWSSFAIPWLEAGGVFAVPNLRGGGEYGKAWHDLGKQGKKQNVFDDFIAAAEYLVKEKWTQPKRLAIRGGSNGGLLVGAVMTQRPDLFGAVVCQVPLLDMVRYTRYGSGKTWISEYGDPELEPDFKTLLAYSPYHHVQSQVRYPPLLMMSADHDDRVDPFHARKFVAQIQRRSRDTPTLLRIEMHAGHGGADQVAKAIESSADLVAWLLDVLKVAPPGTEVTKSK
ncbi:MAG: S9 family peptidase [Myxococcales bacterium]|nr:S9 family peptidase [Myxococcales bacterium]